MIITNCRIVWTVSVGWFGRSGAWNFMHSLLQTYQGIIQPTEAQCHNSGPDEALELNIPAYGNIKSIKVRVDLDGGVGQMSFQPV